MSTYRVVHEITVEADSPLEAAFAMRDFREDHTQHPVLLVYTDDYRIVTQVDMGKPVDQAVTVITGP